MTQLAWPQHSTVTTPSLIGLIRRHPVLTFYVLAFGISWAGILFLVGGPSGVPGTPEQVERLFLLVMVAWFAGPSLASVITTVLVDGRAGLRELLGRLLKWRVSILLFAGALLIAPVVDAATSLGLSLASPDFLPNLVKSTDKAGLLAMALAYGLIGGGFLEELGWTGFAVPRMRSRYGLLGTGLVVGLLWGAYHFSVIYWTTGPSGALPLVILVVQLFAWLPAYRVLMVWVCDRTGSLLVAMLMHASLSASMFILQPMTISGTPLLTYLLVFAAVLWVLVGAVVVAEGRWLAPPQGQMRAA
jgi:uncharacterized protein